jgi:hypothetical protein
MKMTSFTRKRGQAAKISEEERRRLSAKTQKEIEDEAARSPVNPPLNQDRLQRMVMARRVRLKGAKPQ